MWIEIKYVLPPIGEIVETKIDDKDGIRNQQNMIFENNLFWFPDKSMYVYYKPTHWRKT